MSPLDPIYLDFMASTPVDACVIDAMTDAMRETWGNPHSDHAHGFKASKAVERAREAVGALLGAGEDEILFTSGATEANNLAVKGVMTSADRRGHHLVVSSIEHKCVLEAARSLRASGVEVTEVRPGPDGRVSANAIAQALRPETVLVSVMHANNETGVLQPVREIAEICHRHGVLFHTDAAQTVGKIDVDFTGMGADLLSFSGHKFYGPKGIGGLVVARAAQLRLVPQLHGGGQQLLGRSGTVPVPLCAGLGAAARLYERHGQFARAHIQSLQTLFEDRITREGNPFAINPHAERIPGCTSLRAERVNADDILLLARAKISASTGSACNVGNIEPSYVLMAQGLSFEEAAASIRIGIGRTTTEADIDLAVTALLAAHEKAYRAAA